jgi:RNA polymerase sigma-70 factor, ECF subfamily
MFATQTARNDDPTATEVHPPGETPNGVRSEERVAQDFSPGPAATDWTALVEQVKSGDNAGMEQLYKLFSKGVRYFLCRRLGPQELDDKVHDTFLIVVNAIKRGVLREPDRLMGFVRTVVQRQIAGSIQNAVRVRQHETDVESGLPIVDHGRNPEQEAIVRERAALMKSALRALPERDRELLVRFYLKEQPTEQIRQEMSLTETQFRLYKSRAKAKLGNIGREKLARGGFLSGLSKTLSK